MGRKSPTLKSVIVINNHFNLSVIKKLIKQFHLQCSCKKVVEKSKKENLKVIKNTLKNKSGNPESLKKNNQSSWESLSLKINVHIVDEDLLRAF